MDYRKLGFWRLVLLALLLNFVVQAIHEAGHWAVYEALGLNPIWGFTSLVQTWESENPPPINPNEWTETIAPNGEKGWLRLNSSPSKTEKIIALAAGPIAGVLGVIFSLCLAHWNHNPITKQMGLVMALISSLLMSQYYLRGFSHMSGDEYFLAALLGIPKYAIDIPFGLSFITALVLAVRILGDWHTRLKWLGAVMLGSLPAGLFLINANKVVISQVNQENPLFRSVFGWSLPVVLVNTIVLVILWIYWKRANSI